MEANGWIRRGLMAAALVGAVVGSTAGDASAEEGTTAAPAAQVEISPSAKELQRGAARLTFTITCRPGTKVQELALEYSQGDFAHAESASTATTVPCDGRAHKFQWETVEAFDPGPAEVSARLTVLDDSTQDPLPQAVDQQRVWIKPAAKVAIGSPAKLLPGGDARLKVLYTCDQPWIEPSLSVELRQDGGTVGGNASASEGLRCDDRWHTVWLRIPHADIAFHTGPAEATATLDVAAPESFDPVAQARLTRAVRIAR